MGRSLLCQYCWSSSWSDVGTPFTTGESWPYVFFSTCTLPIGVSIKQDSREPLFFIIEPEIFFFAIHTGSKGMRSFKPYSLWCLTSFHPVLFFHFLSKNLLNVVTYCLVELEKFRFFIPSTTQLGFKRFPGVWNDIPLVSYDRVPFFQNIGTFQFWWLLPPFFCCEWLGYGDLMLESIIIGEFREFRLICFLQISKLIFSSVYLHLRKNWIDINRYD